MADITELNYGKGRLKLAKSDKLIGVQPHSGMSPRLEAEIAAASLRQPMSRRGRLGNFDILEVEAPAEATDRELDRLRRTGPVAAGTHVYYTSDDQVPFVPTGELYLVFKPGVAAAEQQAVIARHALKVIEARGEGRFIVRITELSPNPVRVAAALQSDPQVGTAEPELASPPKLRAPIAVEDELLGDQWHLRNRGHHRGTSIGFKAGADARVIAAWEAMDQLGSAEVVVAVIDDGFDLGHPDLAGKAVAPFDFTRETPDVHPEHHPFLPERGDWHGTACAAVALARAEGGGVVGAAPNARLMPVRWGTQLTDRQIERWFGWVTDNGAWIVSCSWGAEAAYFPLSQRMHDAIHDCATRGRRGRGCVVVFAAGNDNRDINDPDGGSLDGFATHPDVIAVAACTSLDERAHYANFGDAVWISAPSDGAGGWGILTADVTGEYVDAFGQTHARGYSRGDYSFEFGGTSSACPLVAGICALVLSVAPELAADQVKALIARTARRLPEMGADAHSRQLGYGCIDAEAAVRAATAGPVVAELSEPVPTA